jgi:hypothetical protein
MSIENRYMFISQDYENLASQTCIYFLCLNIRLNDANIYDFFGKYELNIRGEFFKYILCHKC